MSCCKKKLEEPIVEKVSGQAEPTDGPTQKYPAPVLLPTVTPAESAPKFVFEAWVLTH